MRCLLTVRALTRMNRVVKETTAVGLLIDARLSSMKATLVGVVVGFTVASRPASPSMGMSCSLVKGSAPGLLEKKSSLHGNDHCYRGHKSAKQSTTQDNINEPEAYKA